MAHPHYNHNNHNNNHNEAGNVLNGVNDRSQNAVLKKIKAYLENRGRDTDIIKKMDEGYCLGITTLWLYSKWLSFQKMAIKSKDDYDWLQKIISEISALQKKLGEKVGNEAETTQEIANKRSSYYAKLASINPRDDYYWFQNAISEIITLDEVADKNKS